MEHEHNVKLNICLNKYIELKKKIEDKRKEMEHLQKRREALLDLLAYMQKQKGTEEEGEGEKEGLPLVLGKAHSKFTLTSIGILPPEEYFSFYTPSYIYPIGYKCKRKYNSPTKSEPKLLYYCQIRNINGECVFEIRTTNGKVWAGPKDLVWSSFTSEFEKISFPNIETFFGFTHDTVQKMIEEMGDISVYPSYISYRVRSKKGRKAKKEEEV
ncbi:hypothetical protein NECID01_1029 [Nematocida sp. AWRm77]|nr:hypothetical protein NECID01_1029 [Nematocida sp. AWRm77]